MGIGNYPCRINSTQRIAVSCGFKCESCGFNPTEAARRMRYGHFETRAVAHVLHDDDGNAISTIVNSCRQLVFPPNENSNGRELT